MKTNYALAMLALLLLGIGGSVVGYRTAVNKVAAHEAHAEGGAEGAAAGEHAEAPATEGAAPEAEAAQPEDATTGTGIEADGEGAAAGSEAATQQDTADANATAAAVGAGDADAGKTTFAGSCGGCHGADGQGGLGPAMTANASSWAQPEFVKAVREGVSPNGELAATMPRFSSAQVSDDDLNNIYAWVQSLN